jgi:enamine deaminase RidA (YjgF/YER057c/UK114 family)
MGIERQVITKPIGDIPIVSFVTAHNNMVYLSGVTADPEHLGDIKDQTRQVLDRIDRLLKRAGTDKSKLLNAGLADRYGEFRRPQLGLE